MMNSAGAASFIAGSKVGFIVDIEPDGRTVFYSNKKDGWIEEPYFDKSLSARYTIQPKDTLTGIAKLFHTSVHRLAEINLILNINRIKAGDTIIIPDYYHHMGTK